MPNPNKIRNSDGITIHPEVVELDLNPVFADSHGVIAVDWMMVRATPGAKNREATP